MQYLHHWHFGATKDLHEATNGEKKKKFKNNQQTLQSLALELYFLALNCQKCIILHICFQCPVIVTLSEEKNFAI